MSANDDGHPVSLTQVERFAQLAREPKADEDEARWDERLKKVVVHKSAPEKPE